MIWDLGQSAYGAGNSGDLLGRTEPSAFDRRRPGQPPVITAQPLDLSTTPGLTATFSVTVSGPGPFQYQWRFNGTNIAGATNATLVLAPVDSSTQVSILSS